MQASSRYLPGSGFVALILFLTLLGLLLAWTFATSRIESTIRLEDKGMQMMYRQRYAEALDYFQQSALMDTEKSHHIPRYLDSLRLAIQTGNIDMTAFFYAEVLHESPGSLANGEFASMLGLQLDPAITADLVARLAASEMMAESDFDRAVSDYIEGLDLQGRSAFNARLKQAGAKYRLRGVVE